MIKISDITYINKQKAVICDIDGTLADITERRNAKELHGWGVFSEGMENDKPNEWCTEIIKALKQNRCFKIIFCSGRQEKYRKITEEWIFKHTGLETKDYHIFLRDNEDYRKDSIVKEEIFIKNIEGKFDISFVLDDRKQVVEMWRSKGLVCLQCDEGNF